MAQAGEIELVGVTKQFGSLVAVDNIDLTIPGGSYCCLLGPSGCGKTTILRMIAGHETPSAGDLRIGGVDVVGKPPVARGTAMMFQSYALFPHLTVLDNVAFRLKMQGMGKTERRAKAHEVLERVRLEALAERMPAQLSGGQQQRVALARAVITNPSVLLLDEPLSALDEFLRLQMRGELRHMQRELGITFVHVTHTQLEAIAVADTVVVMDQGRIEQAASSEDIYARPDSAYVARFMGGHNVLHGTVLEVPNGLIRLHGVQGQTFELPSHGATVGKGDQVHFSVRRDFVGLSKGGAADGAKNQSRGTIYAIEYQGTFVKVTLEAAGNDEFVAYIPDGTFFAAPMDIGDEVTAAWQTDDVHLLKGNLGDGGDATGGLTYDKELV